MVRRSRAARSKRRAEGGLFLSTRSQDKAASQQKLRKECLHTLKPEISVGMEPIWPSYGAGPLFWRKELGEATRVVDDEEPCESQ